MTIAQSEEIMCGLRHAQRPQSNVAMPRGSSLWTCFLPPCRRFVAAAMVMQTAAQQVLRRGALNDALGKVSGLGDLSHLAAGNRRVE